MFRDQAAVHIKQVMGGVAHVQDVPLFRILETAGRIALKFGVLLELGVLQNSMVGYICTCARADVSLFISRKRLDGLH